MTHDDTIRYRYTFALDGKEQKIFDVALDAQTLDLVRTPAEACPEWARLDFCRCPNCTLDAAKPWCPVAESIVDVVDFFKDSASCEKVHVTIEAPERTYVRQTSLEDAISSLIGIYTATCGCPVMGKLKPMVRHHLPFATLEETRYRALSTYLLSQYFVFKKGLVPDWELKNLSAIYADIRVANKCFSKRLFQACPMDASVNALVKLDCFAMHVSFLIDNDALREMASQFEAFNAGDVTPRQTI